MNKLKGKYDDIMEFVFTLKERAYTETKGMRFKEYLKHIHKDISEIEEKIDHFKKVKC